MPADFVGTMSIAPPCCCPRRHIVIVPDLDEIFTGKTPT